MRLTLDALIVLDAIQRNGSFAAAADELFRVRSAITYTIQKLEQDLGVTLFDRSKQRAKLTPCGEALLNEGKQLLRSATEIERLVKRIYTGWETELRIACDDSISIEKLFPLIEQFYKECSTTKLNFSTEILGGCWDALISGRADLAIGVSGDVPASSEYGVQHLGQIRFAFVVAPKHPLAKLPEPLKNSDIIKYRAIVAADTSRVLVPRSSGTLLGQEVLTVANLHTKLQAHIAGLGVGYMPLHLIKKEVAAGKLLIKKVQKPKTATNFSVAWRLKQAGKATEWFLGKLKSFKI